MKAIEASYFAEHGNSFPVSGTPCKDHAIHHKENVSNKPTKGTNVVSGAPVTPDFGAGISLTWAGIH